jgi:hypothetical protein
MVDTLPSPRQQYLSYQTLTTTQEKKKNHSHLLVENWLGLTSETHLLVVITTLSLREVRCLTRLVLGDLCRYEGKTYGLSDT